MNSVTQPSPNPRIAPAMDSHQSFPRYSIARFMRAAQETSGSELVEIAVSIPIFLMIILATFQFAIIMFNYESAGFAVRQAARYGSTHSLTSLNPCTTAQITSMTQSSLWSPTGSSTVTVSWPNGNSVGNTILVSVSESYSVGMFNSSFSSINISNSMQYAIMR